MLIGSALIMTACTSNIGSSTGEESVIELDLDESFDQVHEGARFFLFYNPDNNSFQGFAENTTTDRLNRVSVEVHLSTGVVLGPTSPIDILPGGRSEINLFAKNFEFKTWIVHPHVGENKDK